MTDAELKARITEAIRKEPRPPTRAEVRNRNIALFVIALAMSIAIFEWWGGIRDFGDPAGHADLMAHGVAGRRNLALMIPTFLGSLAVTLLAWRVVWVRSRSAFGPPWQHLAAVMLLAPVSLFAVRVGWSSLFYGGLTDVGRLGLKCLGLSMLIATPVFIALLVGRRGSDPVQPGWTGAALGLTSGAAAAVFADLWCPVGYPPHVLLGHVAPMLMFALMGAIAGRRILRLA